MIKRLLITVFFSFFVCIMVAQNTSFGLTAGLIHASGKGTLGDVEETESSTGFYVGGIIDFTISEKFHIQPEAFVGTVEEGSALFVPIMAEFYLSDAFSLQAGPQFDYTFEQVPDNFTSLGIALAAGAAYDISQHFMVEARYAFQVNDYYTGNADASARMQNLTIGLAYMFN